MIISTVKALKRIVQINVSTTMAYERQVFILLRVLNNDLVPVYSSTHWQYGILDDFPPISKLNQDLGPNEPYFDFIYLLFFVFSGE